MKVRLYGGMVCECDRVMVERKPNGPISCDTPDCLQYRVEYQRPTIELELEKA